MIILVFSELRQVSNLVFRYHHELYFLTWVSELWLLFYFKMQDSEIVLQRVPDYYLILQNFMHLLLSLREGNGFLHMSWGYSRDPRPEVCDPSFWPHILIVKNMPVVIDNRNSIYVSWSMTWRDYLASASENLSTSTISQSTDTTGVSLKVCYTIRAYPLNKVEFGLKMESTSDIELSLTLLYV